MAIWNQSTWSITFDRSFLTFGTFIKALALSYFQFWTGNNLCDLWSYTYCGKSLKSIRSNWIVLNRSKIILKFSCWIDRHALLFISDGMFIRIDLISRLDHCWLMELRLLSHSLIVCHFLERKRCQHTLGHCTEIIVARHASVFHFVASTALARKKNFRLILRALICIYYLERKTTFLSILDSF